MKSSILQAIQKAITIFQARFSRNNPHSYRDGTAMWAIKINYKHMKSSISQASHEGMIIYQARFHLTFENLNINR
ncbi:hypothetical protein [Algoriphagus aquimarinus]|uniref:hypothetical protein n=1 Tax=Algoriphagus aquimarinus TaxID=237018 RepID=UPI0030D91D40